MDTKEILKMFCSKDELRPNLAKPFNLNGYTYATNGIIAVRFPLIEGYDVKDPPKIDKAWYQFEVKDSDFFPLVIAREVVDYCVCESCNGKKHDYRCPDCDGGGNVEFESRSGIEYGFECKLCNGHGVIKGECETCNGSGSTPTKIRMDIGSKRLTTEYVDILNRLPNCMIATEASKGYDPIPFKFDGGDGIIMPVRKLEEEEE